METRLFRTLSRSKYRVLFSLSIIILISILYYSNRLGNILPTVYIESKGTNYSEIINVPTTLNIIDMHAKSSENISCIKSKHLLHSTQTTICLHDERDAVSNIIRANGIWEEQFLIELFGFLLRYPEMNFIDAGANVGAYTMFVAALGRTVLSIECFKPNIQRIRRAVQMEKLEDKVIIVGNAIYNESGKYLKMKSDPTNVGSQAIIVDGGPSPPDDDMYTVKTMRFDDILPILKKKNMRNIVMKVDIQWSEIHLCATGGKVFDYANIPIILMEWDRGPEYTTRMNSVLRFFIGRGYVATADMCKTLKEADAITSWPSDIYWVKLNQSEIC